MKVGDVPSDLVMDDLKDSFSAFIVRYVKCPLLRATLVDQLQLFLDKDGASFRDGAFSPETVNKYKHNSARWWRLYAKASVADLAKLASLRTQICKSSSSSSERNISVWGLIKSKLRNRLSLTKAEKLVYIFSNIRLLRRVRNDPRWCPDLDFDTGTSGEDAPPDDLDLFAVAEWWELYCAALPLHAHFLPSDDGDLGDGEGGRDDGDNEQRRHRPRTDGECDFADD